MARQGAGTTTMQSEIAETTARQSRNNCKRYACSALAAGLVAACLQASPATAAFVEVNRFYYQEQVNADCTGSTCKAFFINLAPLHGLEISHVRCGTSVTSGAVLVGTAYYQPQSPTFGVPLASISQTTASLVTRQTLDSAVRFKVPRNRQLLVSFQHNGSVAVGYCVAVGERVIYKQQ